MSLREAHSECVNSSNNFQQLANVVFDKLAHAGTLAYIDDIVIGSKVIVSHLEKLNAVFLN